MIDVTINSLIVNAEVTTKDFAGGKHHLPRSDLVDVIRIAIAIRQDLMLKVGALGLFSL